MISFFDTHLHLILSLFLFWGFIGCYIFYIFEQSGKIYKLNNRPFLLLLLMVITGPVTWLAGICASYSVITRYFIEKLTE